LEKPDEHWVTLTPAGREVARLFTADGEAPKELEPLVEKLRRPLDDAEAAQEAEAQAEAEAEDEDEDEDE
jgi:hypothetical protein